MASSFSRFGTDDEKRRYSPTRCSRCATSGLRSQAWNGPRRPPRGPDAIASATSRWAGVISCCDSGGKRGGRSAMAPFLLRRGLRRGRSQSAAARKRQAPRDGSSRGAAGRRRIGGGRRLDAKLGLLAGVVEAADDVAAIVRVPDPAGADAVSAAVAIGAII